MFGRLINVIKGLLNQGISKVETPEILAEQAEMQLEATQKQLKEALIASLTAEKALEQKLQKDSEEVSTWQKRAELAITKGDDQLAKQCLQKRQDAEQTLVHLKTQLDSQKSATAALKEKVNEHDQKVREFQTKKKDLVARAQASQATAKANEILSGGASGSGSIDKLEERIRATELRNEAIADLRAGGDKALEDKVKELDAESDLDSQLAMLKLKVEQQKNQPKLIETREEKLKALPAPKDDAVTVEEVEAEIEESK